MQFSSKKMLMELTQLLYPMLGTVTFEVIESGNTKFERIVSVSINGVSIVTGRTQAKLYETLKVKLIETLKKCS